MESLSAFVAKLDMLLHTSFFEEEDSEYYPIQGVNTNTLNDRFRLAAKESYDDPNRNELWYDIMVAFSICRDVHSFIKKDKMYNVIPTMINV